MKTIFQTLMMLALICIDHVTAVNNLRVIYLNNNEDVHLLAANVEVICNNVRAC